MSVCFLIAVGPWSSFHTNYITERQYLLKNFLYPQFTYSTLNSTLNLSINLRRTVANLQNSCYKWNQKSYKWTKEGHFLMIQPSWTSNPSCQSTWTANDLCKFKLKVCKCFLQSLLVIIFKMVFWQTLFCWHIRSLCYTSIICDADPLLSRRFW